MIQEWASSFTRFAVELSLFFPPHRLALRRRRLPYATVFLMRNLHWPTDEKLRLRPMRLPTFSDYDWKSMPHQSIPSVYARNGIIADLLPARSLVCRNKWDSRWNILSRAEDLIARFGRLLRFLLMKQFFLLLDDYLLACLNSWRIFIVYSVFSSSSLCFFSYFCSHNVLFRLHPLASFRCLAHIDMKKRKKLFLLRYDFYCAASWWAKKLHELCVCEHEAPERERARVENLWKTCCCGNGTQNPTTKLRLCRLELHGESFIHNNVANGFPFFLCLTIALRLETQLRVAGESFVWAYGKSKLFFRFVEFSTMSRGAQARSQNGSLGCGV